MKSIKKKLKDEIPNGLDNTFDLIAAIILPASQYYDDYILQKGKYKQLSKLWHKGTLKLDDYQIEESKIREAVISFINDLEEEDVHSNLIKSNKKEGVITRTNTEFRNLDSFRRALPRTEAIVSNFNALNLIVGECIELVSHPNLQTGKQLEDFGWNPLNEEEISIKYENSRFPIGELDNIIAPDERLKPPNGRKFCLSSIEGGLIDEPNLLLKTRHSDYFTVKSLVNQFGSSLPEEIIYQYGHIEPEKNKIPHSLCLHQIVLLDDGHILCQLRGSNVAYYPNCYSFSQEEQLAVDDFHSKSPTLSHLVIRAICEEFFPLSGSESAIFINYQKYLAPIIDTMKIWSVFIESSIFNFSMLSFVKFNITIDEYVNLYKNLLNKGVVDKEGTVYYTSIEEARALLVNGQCNMSGAFSKKRHMISLDDLHPTSLYRIFKLIGQIDRVS